jgi:hypothetical protein
MKSASTAAGPAGKAQSAAAESASEELSMLTPERIAELDAL